jgi:hypothetical protein
MLPNFMEKINRPDRRKQNIINNLTLSFSRRKFGTDNGIISWL